MDVAEHLENHLGRIVKGWNTPDEANFNYSVVQFDNQPNEGFTTLSTLGVSLHRLKLHERKDVRQEFLMTYQADGNDEEIAKFLLRIGDLVLSRHEAVLRGQVIGPGSQLFKNSKVNAVYATNAVLFDDSFEVYEESDPPTVMVWLIPIYDVEANYVNQNGWEAFEDLLQEQDPELWDFNRKPIV